HLLALIFFPCSGVHRHLHSFPTRRSSDLFPHGIFCEAGACGAHASGGKPGPRRVPVVLPQTDGFEITESVVRLVAVDVVDAQAADRKSTRLNSSHVKISYAVFCLKKKKEN